MILPPAEIIIEYHDLVIKEFGGLDVMEPYPGRLESAVGAIESFVCFKDGCNVYDVESMVCFYIARGHIFRDGNKRTSFVTMMRFLALNATRKEPEMPHIATLIECVADGTIDSSCLAQYLRKKYEHPDND